MVVERRAVMPGSNTCAALRAPSTMGLRCLCRRASSLIDKLTGDRKHFELAIGAVSLIYSDCTLDCLENLLHLVFAFSNYCIILLFN